ncbi:MAG: KTSC domain-containing protein [Saprospiraceae bacterium]|nr:KTSC domain-containing protein [Saprospiraceae bacterium]
MNKSILTLSFYIALIIPACRLKESCDTLPSQFSSYDQAVLKIESSDFKIKEIANTSKSSWIRGASFYSCDGNTGYYILQTDNQDYLYTNMPYSVWIKFKNAESLGKFYNENIKHRYIFQLTK